MSKWEYIRMLAEALCIHKTGIVCRKRNFLKTKMEKKLTVMQTENNPPVKLMCWGNNYHAPCTDPFNLKLQTYMRMAEIQYEVKSCVMSSSKGKVPYIQVNTKQIEDSTEIINFLYCEFGKNLNSSMSKGEIEKAFSFQRLIEGSLHWSLQYQKWILDENVSETFPLNNWFFRLIFKLMLKCKIRPELQQHLEKHNMGSRTQEKLIQIAERDLSTLSQHLDDKPFFMGEEPCEIDATVFGFVGLLLNGMENSPSGEYVRKNLGNLVAYVDRMKTAYWSDWNELCSQRTVPTQKGSYCRRTERACSSKKVTPLPKLLETETNE